VSELNRGGDPQVDVRWRLLHKLSGWAALVAALLFRRNLAEEFLLLRLSGILHSGPQAFPGSAADWFTLLRTHPLVGLTFLNLFDMVNYALVGLIFLGLCQALFRVNKSAMTLAMALTLVAVAVYFASNQAFALLSLSDQYAAATTDAQRSALLAAGQALLAIHNSSANYGNGPYVSFLFVNFAGLIIAAVMLGSAVFGKFAAWTGIVANLFGLSYYLTQTLAPSMSAIPLSASAPFLLIWYLVAGRKLLRLGSGSSNPDGDVSWTR
jgi:hypothetical protein